MAEESIITLREWPSDRLRVAHAFEAGEACPVRVSVDSPIGVTVATGELPLDVRMNMAVSAEKPVPLCLTLCEPICAKSDYSIELSVFDQLVANIRVQGMTRLFNCNDETTKRPNETPVS